MEQQGVAVVYTQSEQSSSTPATTMDQPPKLVTVQTPDEGTQVIMLTFDSSPSEEVANVRSFTEESSQTEKEFLETVEERFKHTAVQTETVFTLKDLPTINEMVQEKVSSVNKTSAAADLSVSPRKGEFYHCSICAKVYRHKISWQNHLKTHAGQTISMCGFCGKLFCMKNILEAHLQLHAREAGNSRVIAKNPKSAGIDMKVDEIADTLPPVKFESSEEQQVPLYENPMETDDVEAEEASNVINDGVASMDNANYIYACNICGKQYLVKSECEKHLKVHTGYVEPEVPEPEADPDPEPEPPDESTKTVVEDQVEEEKKSKITLPSPPKPADTSQNKYSGYIYACNICGKQYTNKSNCKRHMKIHTNEEKNFQCSYCNKKFAQKYEVRMHSRIHTGEKPFKCQVCGKLFTERGNWKRHTSIHTRPQEDAPYRCGICSKGFFHSDKLRIHLQIHTGQRPFVCTICGRKAKKIGDMYRHLRTHTGEKPYSCQVCGKGFAQNGNLKDHMKTHTGQRPFKCDICNRTFSRRVFLRDHKKKHMLEEMEGEMEDVGEEVEEVVQLTEEDKEHAETLASLEKQGIIADYVSIVKQESTDDTGVQVEKEGGIADYIASVNAVLDAANVLDSVRNSGAVVTEVPMARIEVEDGQTVEVVENDGKET